MPVRIYTIGFAKKTAEQFFTKLLQEGVKRVIDIRLNNESQLAAFTKKRDLEYFLRKIGGIEYIHLPDLAPTKEILNEYKKGGRDWSLYEQRFMNLMKSRKINELISPQLLHESCLLCSEPTPDFCHRRLIVEYLQKHWTDVKVHHIL